MGSFNATCIVSNLQIQSGDPVRYVLLVKSRFNKENGHACYVSGRWQLRGPAVHAKYNDYGSINGWDETLTTRVTFDALSIDAVEKGIGDNEFHDAPVRVEMDIRGWLGALWEGRVQVDDNGRRSRSAQGTYEEYQPKETFIPTFKRVEAVLTAQECFDRMLVDQVNLGFFRVRAAKFGPDKTHVPLEPLVDAFQKAGFAAMVTCPTGHYGDRPEILVAPPPPPPGESIHTHGLQEDHHMDSVRPVCQAMIREDVWQILLNTPLDWWPSDEKVTFEMFAEKGKSACAAYLEKKKAVTAAENAADEEDAPLTAGKEAWHLALALNQFERDDAFFRMLGGSEGVSGFSFRESLALAFQAKQSDEEFAVYFQDLLETVFVQTGYASLHGQWHPTTNSGQDPLWDEHRAFHAKLAQIKGRWEDDADDDQEDQT